MKSCIKTNIRIQVCVLENERKDVSIRIILQRRISSRRVEGGGWRVEGAPLNTGGLDVEDLCFPPGCSLKPLSSLSSSVLLETPPTSPLTPLYLPLPKQEML